VCNENVKDKAHCRKCGGERWHFILAKEDRAWSEDEGRVSGSDSWQILECCGCETITFRHTDWFSEITDPDGTPILKKDQYPPSSSRKSPEWLNDLYVCVNIDEILFVGLLVDIYATMGLKAFSLSAMGARTVVDWLVTKAVGDVGTFRQKLEKMRDMNKITPERVDVIYAAFDAASAAAHRGHSPTESELSTILDIMERLLYDLVVKPYHDKKEAEAAKKLKESTPKRNQVN